MCGGVNGAVEVDIKGWLDFELTKPLGNGVDAKPH